METTKISQVRCHMQAEEWQKAVSLAAKFPRLGEQRSAILSAHGAYTNPGFYVQMGKNLKALQDAGKNALLDRFGLQK